MSRVQVKVLALPCSPRRTSRCTGHQRLSPGNLAPTETKNQMWPRQHTSFPCTRGQAAQSYFPTGRRRGRRAQCGWQDPKPTVQAASREAPYVRSPTCPASRLSSAKNSLSPSMILLRLLSNKPVAIVPTGLSPSFSQVPWCRMSPKNFSCLTNILFGALRSYWPPQAAHHQLHCFFQRLPNVVLKRKAMTQRANVREGNTPTPPFSAIILHRKSPCFHAERPAQG